MSRTKESRSIRPFDEVKDAFADVLYRPDPSANYVSVKEHALKVVDVDDLRVDATHTFRIAVATTALRTKHPGAYDKLTLLVLTRDALLKRAIVLARLPIDRDMHELTLDRDVLETTSLKDEIAVDFVLALANPGSLRAGHTNRRGSWVARHRVVLTRDLLGPSMPFRKVTGEEFVHEGLPAATGWYLRLPSGPEALLEECSELAAAFEVWVHEDIWTTLQEIGKTSLDVSLGNLIASSILTNVVSSAIQARVASGNGDEPDPTSPLVRCMNWIGRAHEQPIEELLARFAQNPSAIGPLIWSALGCNKSIRTTDFRGIDL